MAAHLSYFQTLNINIKNKINIKTEKYKKGIFKKEFEIIGLNTITGEEWKTKDSIKYRLIKKEN